MTRVAPRLDPRLLRAIERHDRRDHPIAETNRRIGELADTLGLPRPSYEQVRTVVHETRNRVRTYDVLDATIDISFGTRPPRAVADALIEGEPRPARK